MTLTVDDSAVKRIEELRTAQGKDGLMLRVRVDGGGCSGFQYKLELTEDANANEETFENCVLSDDISLTFLKGAVIKPNLKSKIQTQLPAVGAERPLRFKDQTLL